jgi:surfeit locus 1 family protein
MRIRFAPRLVPTLAAFAMIALMVWLGRWQADRAGEKTERQAMFEARVREAPLALSGDSGPAEALIFRRVRVTGLWVPEGQIFIDNQIHQGRAGFHVVTPLRVAGSGRVVLVNRGWTPRTAHYPAAPPVGAPAGEAQVTGLAALPPRRVLELSRETISGNVWQNLSLERYAQHTRLALLPVVVLSDGPEPGFVPVREQPDAGIAKHREYSLTWFSLAATLAILWIVLSVRRDSA